MADGANDLTGRIFARTYQVEGVLGEGGMGAVYRVRHLRTGGLLALKLLHREVSQSADIFRRFQEEARITSALRHPSIIQVTDFDQDDDGTPFIVMELLDGEDLYQRLRRRGSLGVDEVIEVAAQAGSALQAAHEKGVIHRDIKPQNLFFSRHQVAGETTETIKVVDFGLSKIRRVASQQTRDNVVAGTPYYMAPEVARGSRDLDGRADQFSLAVVLYRALSGRLPFDDDDVMGVIYKVMNQQPLPLGTLVPGLPPYVLSALDRAMSKDREARFPTMADFVRAFTGGAMLSGPRPLVNSRPHFQQTLLIPTITTSIEGAAAAIPSFAPRTSMDSVPSAPNKTLSVATGQFVQLNAQPQRRVRTGTLVLGLLGVLGVVLLVLTQRPRPNVVAAPPPSIGPVVGAMGTPDLGSELQANPPPVAPPPPSAPPIAEELREPNWTAPAPAEEEDRPRKRRSRRHKDQKEGREPPQGEERHRRRRSSDKGLTVTTSSSKRPLRELHKVHF